MADQRRTAEQHLACDPPRESAMRSNIKVARHRRLSVQAPNAAKSAARFLGLLQRHRFSEPHLSGHKSDGDPIYASIAAQNGCATETSLLGVVPGSPVDDHPVLSLIHSAAGGQSSSAFTC
jgi:hypothetical protein